MTQWTRIHIHAHYNNKNNATNIIWRKKVYSFQGFPVSMREGVTDHKPFSWNKHKFHRFNLFHYIFLPYPEGISHFSEFPFEWENSHSGGLVGTNHHWQSASKGLKPSQGGTARGGDKICLPFHIRALRDNAWRCWHDSSPPSNSWEIYKRTNYSLRGSNASGHGGMPDAPP
jgi:hypothetical protein